MKNRLHRILIYQANDTAAIAAYCEKMAARGWLLDGSSGSGLSFRRIEPEKLTFAVTFFPDASVFDPEPTEPQSDYADFCRAAGWTLAAANGPMQVFYSRAECPTPIETDERCRFEATRKAMRKTLVLPFSMLLIIQLYNLLDMPSRFRLSPLSFVSSTPMLLAVLVSAAAAVMFIWLLADHGIWCLRSKRSLENGGDCPAPSTRSRLVGTCAVFVLVAAALAALAFSVPQNAAVPLLLAGLVLVYILAFAVFRLLKKLCKSREAVRWGYVAAAIILALAFALIAVPAIEAVSGREPKYVYASEGGYERDIFADELPLTLEALGYTVTEADHCSREAENRRSPLADYAVYEQTPYGDGTELPTLSYSVTHIPSDALRALCWRALNTPQTLLIGGHRVPLPGYEPSSAADWGALEASTQENVRWHLLYPDRIVTVSFYGYATPNVLPRLQAFAAGT